MLSYRTRLAGVAIAGGLAITAALLSGCNRVQLRTPGVSFTLDQQAQTSQVLHVLQNLSDRSQAVNLTVHVPASLAGGTASLRCLDCAANDTTSGIIGFAASTADGNQTGTYSGTHLQNLWPGTYAVTFLRAHAPSGAKPIDTRGRLIVDIHPTTPHYSQGFVVIKIDAYGNVSAHPSYQINKGQTVFRLTIDIFVTPPASKNLKPKGIQLVRAGASKPAIEAAFGAPDSLTPDEVLGAVNLAAGTYHLILVYQGNGFHDTGATITIKPAS